MIPGSPRVLEQQSGDPLHLVVGERVERIDQDGPNAGRKRLLLPQQFVHERQEERFGLAGAGSSRDKVVFLSAI